MHSPKANLDRHCGHGKRKDWIGLAAGVALDWVMASVVLAWGQTLPSIRPVLKAIIDPTVDTGTYWYSQCEGAAVAQMHIRYTLCNRQFAPCDGAGRTAKASDNQRRRNRQTAPGNRYRLPRAALYRYPIHVVVYPLKNPSDTPPA